MGENANVERGFHNEVPFRYKLLITIWWLANQETFRQIADRFGTTRGNAHYICQTTCKFVAERVLDFLSWPPRNRLEEIANEFRFPGTIGTSDIVYFKLK